MDLVRHHRVGFVRTSAIFLVAGIALGLASGRLELAHSAAASYARHKLPVKVASTSTQVATNDQPTESNLLKWLDIGVNADPDSRAAAVLHIQDALAGQSIKGSVAYYAVTGSTHADVRQSMESRRGRYTHADFDANTEWRIHYKYTPAATVDAGSSTFTADETITITMPQWQNEKDGDPALAHTWDTYIRDLVFHEEGHYLIDEACLAAMRNRVARLPGNAPFADVDALCKQTMRDYSVMNDDYDRETRHGATQGASF